MNELKTDCHRDCSPHVTNTKQGSYPQNSRRDSLKWISHLHSTQHVRIPCILYRTMLNPPCSTYNSIFITTQVISGENMTRLAPRPRYEQRSTGYRARMLHYTVLFVEKWINTSDKRSREERKNPVPQTQLQPLCSAHLVWPQESEVGGRDLNTGWVHSTLSCWNVTRKPSDYWASRSKDTRTQLWPSVSSPSSDLTGDNRGNWCLKLSHCNG